MNINQSGRSMIEMLGVLAIVGVLSVGGIAGYSKAMQKHKINQTTNQIIHIAGGIQTLFANQATRYAGADNMTILVKANIISQDMVEEYEDDTSYSSKLAEAQNIKNTGTGSDQFAFCNRLGGSLMACGQAFDNVNGYNMEDFLRSLYPKTSVQTIATPLGATITVTAGSKVFALNLVGVPQDACIDLASQNWSAGTDNFLGLSVGDKSVTSGAMSVADAVAGCAADENTISLMFK